MTNYYNALQKDKRQIAEVKECPIFKGRHKWSVFFVKHPIGKIWYCQFCFIEKLICFDEEFGNIVSKFYQRGTFYDREYKSKEKERKEPTGKTLKTNPVSTIETNEKKSDISSHSHH